MVGGLSSTLSGRNFSKAFLSTGVVQALSPGIDNVGFRGAAANTHTFYRIGAAAIVGGLGARLAGGSFENGAASAGFLQSTAEAADYYEQNVGQSADVRPGDNRPDQTTYTPNPVTGRQELNTVTMNVVGSNDLTSFCRQGSMCSKFLNAIPGINATARLHDYWFNVPDAPEFTIFNNVATMLPAAAISYGAAIGNITQDWLNNPMTWYVIPQGRSRD